MIKLKSPKVQKIDIKPSSAGGPGVPGLSAYELAVQEGYTGTLEEWLRDLKGKDGAPGGLNHYTLEFEHLRNMFLYKDRMPFSLLITDFKGEGLYSIYRTYTEADLYLLTADGETVSKIGVGNDYSDDLSYMEPSELSEDWIENPTVQQVIDFVISIEDAPPSRVYTVSEEYNDLGATLVHEPDVVDKELVLLGWVVNAGENHPEDLYMLHILYHNLFHSSQDFYPNFLYNSVTNLWENRRTDEFGEISMYY